MRKTVLNAKHTMFLLVAIAAAVAMSRSQFPYPFSQAANQEDFVATCSSTLAEQHGCDRVLPGVAGDWYTKDGSPDELVGSWVALTPADGQPITINGIRLIDSGTPKHDITDSHFEFKTATDTIRFPTTGGIGSLTDRENPEILLPQPQEVLSVRFVIDGVSAEARHVGLTEMGLIYEKKKQKAAGDVLLVTVRGTAESAQIENVETLKNAVEPFTAGGDAGQYTLQLFAKDDTLLEQKNVDIPRRFIVKEFTPEGVKASNVYSNDGMAMVVLPSHTDAWKVVLRDRLTNEVIEEKAITQQSSQ